MPKRYTPKGPPKKRGRPRKAEASLLTLTLKRQHKIGPSFYGPGIVKVAKDVADVLLEQERNADREEARFHDSSPPSVIIGPRLSGVVTIRRFRGPITDEALFQSGPESVQT